MEILVEENIIVELIIRWHYVSRIVKETESQIASSRLISKLFLPSSTYPIIIEIKKTLIAIVGSTFWNRFSRLKVRYRSRKYGIAEKVNDQLI